MEAFAGCVAACRNAAAVLGGTWTVVGRDDPTPRPALEADVLVLSSWDRRYDALLAERRGPTVARWHSTMLQTELCREAPKLARILGLLAEGRLAGLAVSDPDLVGALGRDGVVFLPEVLDDGEYRGVAPCPLLGVNVSLFGAPHWRKNLLLQTAAFARARTDHGARRWTLHLNGQAIQDEAYALWLEATRIPYVDHGWLERPRYLALVAGMEAGLCATLSEGYGYVAADHVALGVPIVASPGIACLGEHGVRARPDSVDEVARALAQAVADGDAVTATQRAGLQAQARSNAGVARSAMRRLEGRAGARR
jgi:glycosyltransferase involved in cell wall biosynthesis